MPGFACELFLEFLNKIASFRSTLMADGITKGETNGGLPIGRRVEEGLKDDLPVKCRNRNRFNFQTRNVQQTPSSKILPRFDHLACPTIDLIIVRFSNRRRVGGGEEGFSAINMLIGALRNHGWLPGMG